MRACTGCKIEKADDQFWINRATGRPRTRCKACMNQYHRNYLARASGTTIKPRPEYTRAWHLKKKYGLSLEAYDALLRAQGGGCAICGSLEPGGMGAFHVDHDHACCAGRRTCGRCVRGLLCIGCNMALGAAQDNIERLETMIGYLEVGAVDMFAPSGSQRPSMTPTPSVTGG